MHQVEIGGGEGGKVRPDSLKYSLNCLSSDWGEHSHGLREIKSEQPGDKPGEEEIDSFHFICSITPHLCLLLFFFLAISPV